MTYWKNDTDNSKKDGAYRNDIYQDLFENSHEAILLTTPDGHIMAANPQACRIFGASEDELKALGRGGVVDVTDPNVAKALEERERTGRFSGELTLLRTNGEKFSADVSSSVFAGRNGAKVTSMVIRDITVRKEEEKALDRLNRVYAVISEINQTILRVQDREKLFSEACRIAVEYGRFRMAWVGILRDEEGIVEPVASAGNEESYLKTMRTVRINDGANGRGPTGRAICTGKYATSIDIAKDPDMLPWREEALKRGYGSSIALPIRIGERVMGALTIYASEPDFFAESEIELLQEIAENISFKLRVLEEEIKRKAAETSLRESEGKFRALVEGTRSVIVIHDGERFLYANPASCEVSGYTLEELAAVRPFDLIFPDDRDVVRKILESKRAGTDDGKRHEYRIQGKSGKPIWIDSTGVMIDYNGTNALLISAVDITERKLLEERLRERTRYIETIMENSPIGYVVHSIDNGEMRFITHSFEDTYGLDHGTIDSVETFYRSVFRDPGTRQRMKTMFSESLSTGDPSKMRWNNVPIQLASGETRYVSIFNVPVEDQNLMVSAVQDVTEHVLVEEALRSSEERFRTLVERSAAAILIYDGKKMIYANPAASVLTGYSNSELLGMELRSLIHPESFEIISKNSAERFEGARVEGEQEHPIITKSGEKKWVAFSGTRIMYDGAPALIGMWIDVSEKKRAEENERILLAAMSGAADAVIVADAAGVVQYINDAFERLTGYTRAEVLGRELSVSSPLDADSSFAGLVRKVLASGKDWRGELLSSKKDGTVYDEAVSITPVYDRQNSVTRVIAIRHDVSDRKVAERALRESELKFRSLVESPLAAIWIHDGEHFLYANGASLELTGYDMDELLSLRVLDLVHPEHRELVTRIARDRISGNGTPSHYEYQILRKSGEAIWIDFSGSVIEYQGKRAVLGSGYDITERKKLQERLSRAEKMEGIARLAGGIAHDYNNMLGVVMGYTQLMKRKLTADSPLLRYMDLIDSAAKRGADLTKQLLAVASRQTASPKPIDLKAAIVSLYAMLEELVREEVLLQLNIDQDTKSINIDPSQLDQIIFNIVTNALDAISGTGTITIKTENITLAENEAKNGEDLPGGDYVALSITDNGAGMDKSTLDRIFEPFFTTKPKGKGTGLGLATVFGIVQQYGGSITVSSEPGRGTTFRILFPAYLGEVEPEHDPTFPTETEGTETILLVEDQPDLLEIAKSGLEEYGYHVLAALGPMEALHLFKAHSSEIDLLLTDVIMPDMNGKELRAKLLKEKPELKTLFMSGYTSDVIASRGILNVDVDLIQKPFTPAALSAKVRMKLDS